MKAFFREYYIILIITALSAVALCALSYLTVLDYSYSNEEQYIITCNETAVEEIETSLQYGKRLSNYYGIGQVLQRSRELISDGGMDSIVVVEDADGNVIATTKDEDHFVIPLSEYGTVRQDILDGDKTAGVLTTYYSKKNVVSSLAPSARRSTFGSIGILALLIIVLVTVGVKKNWQANRIVFAAVAAIVLQGIFLTAVYEQEFVRASEKSIKGVASYIGASIDGVLEKGVEMDEIADLGDYLEKKKQENDFIKDIYIERTEKVVDDDDLFVAEIENTDSSLVLSCRIADGYIRKNVINMVLMFVATIILAVIVLKESLPLSDMIAFRKSGEFEKPVKDQYDNVARAIRYGNFLSLTFEYMCLSFSALQIKEWNQGAWGLSPVMAAALSISICSIADIAGMIAMPAVSKKMNTRLLMIVSAVVIAVSNLSCFFTGSTVVIIVMRFFAGAGAAGTKQVRNEVITKGCGNEEQRNSNLTASNMGVIGGLLCGLGLGGVVAGVFGYQATFLVAGVGHLLYLLFEYACIPWKLIAEHASVTSSEGPGRHPLKRIGAVISSFSVWRTLITIVVPQYFLIMIIVCLIPGRIQSLELPGVVLTYANLLNGIIGLYVGEIVYSKLRGRIKNDLKIQAIVLAAGAVSLMMLDIPFAFSLLILISASIAGLLDGVGTPVSTDLFMKIPAINEHLNGTESLMVYSVIGSAVMAIAPFILELCEKSMIWMFSVGGVFLLLSAVLFAEKGSAES
ncbi:MAG: MFS transporter [Lachnospiraceae bacterium]|nr:MFS transporter [Lachnospiraceae bacterium]